MRKEALLEIKPDALDRVQFGRVGGQRHERDVGWNRKRVRAMPACLIEHHHGMVILGKRLGKAVKEGLHRRRIGIGHHQRESIVRARLDGRKDVGEGEALIAKPRRALSALPPDMTDTALLTDARLVLEEQAKAFAFMTSTDGFQQRRSPF